VVDDNRVNQRMVGLVLSKAGWDYEVSENGADAVERMREKPFDLVLMDCRMPVMDGFEATRMIRDSEHGTDRHVPIVAVTANTSNEDRLACSECGMDDFLGKPVRSAQLVRVLDTWLAPAGSRS
jgi:CheY-like chemotaxis protein